MPVTTPLEAPVPGSAPDPAPVLTDEETKKYAQLLERVRGWKEIACAKDASKTGPVTDDESVWLTRECLIRYLNATKWHETEAEKRLHDTLAWRREFGVQALSPEHISPENETGKQVIVGYDRQCRPCLYLRPAHQNTEQSHRQVEHLVFMIERVLDLLPPGQETMSLNIDFTPSANRKTTPPGLGLAKECLHILQMHYPERLGHALIVNQPWYVSGFFRLITPFIDPRTAHKIKFNQNLTHFVPPEHLLSDYEGGQLDFAYDHAQYWPALWALSQKRRAERLQRWEAGGKSVGQSEPVLYGRNAPAAAPGAEAATTQASSEKMPAKVEETPSVPVA